MQVITSLYELAAGWDREFRMGGRLQDRQMQQKIPRRSDRADGANRQRQR